MNSLNQNNLKYSEIDNIQNNFIRNLENPNVFGFIYKITNKHNGKVYIGQTSCDLKVRFAKHIRDSIGKRMLNTRLAKSIREYGYDSFSIEPIDVSDSQENLNEKEMYWVTVFNSIENGYNEMIPENRSGGHTCYSKTDAELDDIRKRISEGISGDKNGNSSSIKCKNIKTNEEIFFNTIKEAQIHFNEKSHSPITKRCSNKIKSLYKDEWLFSYSNRDYNDKSEVYSNRFKTGRRRVMVEVIGTEEKRVFKSYKSVERYYSLKDRTIRSKNALLPGASLVIDGKYKMTVLG